MNSISIDLWIILIGALCSISCCIPGTWLMVRGELMLGDSISHAVLPGVAIAFLLSGSRSPIWMLLGAGLTSLVMILFYRFLNKKAGVDNASALGITFTTLFAIGLVLIAQGASSVDLDPNCVLYGSLELAPLNTVNFYSISVPKTAIIIFVVFLFNLLLTVFLYRSWTIVSFDPVFAKCIGLKKWLYDFLLILSTTVTCIFSFEVVGTILVVSMLTIPAATAFIISSNLKKIFFLSILFSVLSSLIGHILFAIIPSLLIDKDLSTAGGISVTSGFVFLIVLFTHKKIKRLFFKTE